MANLLNQPYPIPLSDGGTAANLSDPNADRILFWDDSAGAMTWLTAGTGLGITGTTLSATGGGAGTIVQIVYGSTTTGFVVSGSTYVASGLTATITPTSASNHILIMGSIFANVSTGSSKYMGLKLYRAGASIVDFGNDREYGFDSVGVSSQIRARSTTVYYDAPATTSSTTYEYYVNMNGGSGQAIFCPDSQLATIVLMEVAL